MRIALIFFLFKSSPRERSFLKEGSSLMIRIKFTKNKYIKEFTRMIYKIKGFLGLAKLN